jgi:transposase
MSASKKILAKQSKRPKRHARGKRVPSAETTALSAKIEELERENYFLRKESAKQVEQVKFWRSEAERDSASEEENHWRRRYFARHQEAQRLEGQLALAKNYITELEKDIADKDAQIDKLRRKLFEASSEKQPLDANGDEAADTAGTSNSAGSSIAEKRKRGGQPGTTRPGPRAHDHLPVDDDRTYDIPESCCEDCGDQWQELSSRDSDQVEVNVRAFRRKIRRKRYGHFCKKKGRWVSKTAQGPKPLFPHSKYGISVWVFLLVGKYVLHMAANRVRLLLKEHALNVPQGTMTAGFKRIRKLIKPLIAEIKRYSREEKHHWHIDDTGWKVFVLLDGKEGFGWYLWVFLSDDVCVYILCPSRARAVPKSHLEHSCGVVSSDRLQSNRKLGDHLIYAFCWVHERREFRNLANGYPEIATICNVFLKLIGSLFHHNAQRLLNEPGTAQHEEAEKKLESTLDEILARCQTELAKADLHPELRRVFNGIVTDWDGLHLFFDLPAVPPDNNPAERALRGPVVGRKNYYGCGSKESAEFTAEMFTLDATLKLNNINTGQFLTEYLEACAANNGKAPRDAIKFLPWHRPPPPNN